MNLPTKLTVLRIFLSFIVIAILTFPFYTVGITWPRYNIMGVIVNLKYVVSGVIFIIASITDFIDGYLARKNNQVTDTGKMLDAIADKILVNSVLIILAAQGFISVIIPVVIVLRDIIVNAIKMEAAGKGKVVAAIKSGKIKTAALMTGTVLTFFYNLPFELININVADFLLYFATIMSIVSAVEYFVLNKNIIFIIEIDKKAVTLALKNKYNNDCNKADEYLEKIFPLNFEITSKIQNDNLLNYIEKVMDLDNKRAKFVLDFFNEINFNNSRHLKKVLRKYYLMKNYLKTKIDLNNDFCIVLVLYMIILNTFYEDEYRILLEKNKEKNYNEIHLEKFDSNTGQIISRPFLKYFKLIEVEEKNLYSFIMRFSSSKYIKSSMKCLGTNSEGVYIDYSDWKNNFQENICSKFIDFILDNIECLEFLIVNKEIDKDKLYSYICLIDDIM